MGLDQQGFFWLSNPWVAAVAAVMAVGLLLWCHRSRGADDSDAETAVPARARRAPRTFGPSGRRWGCQATLRRERRDADPRCAA